MKKLLLAVGLLLFTWSPVSAIDISSYQTSEIRMTPLGSESVIRVGTLGELGRFRLTNQGKKDVALHSLRFRNYGSADLAKTFDSYGLYADGHRISHRVQVSRKYITLLFDDFVLERGESEIFMIKGRLVYSPRGKFVKLGVKREEDLDATERNTGANARLTFNRSKMLKRQDLKTGGIIIYRQPRRVYRGR